MQQADDEDSDSDYVPRAEVERDSDVSEDEGPSGSKKRARLPTAQEKNEAETQESLEERNAREKREREALWRSFKEDTSASLSLNRIREDEKRKMQMVKIVKKMRFAGDDITQIVEVPEDSKEAKEWPLWAPSESITENESANGHSTGEPISKSDSGPQKGERPLGYPSGMVAATINSATNPTFKSDSTTSKQPEDKLSNPKSIPPPNPKKRKTFSSLPTPSKPKKLTTLSKSMMDWNAHLTTAESSQNLTREQVEELEANRKEGGGGYIERVEFMERVRGRKDDVMSGNNGKRRKR